MDGRGFDDLVRRLAARQSRRSVLRGVIGGGAALLASRSRRVLAAPAGKVDICHLDEEGVYHLIPVNGNAVDAHLAHGDQLPDACGPNCACCILDLQTGCLGNEECCSGICQGGQCVPTLSGTCSAEVDFCVEGFELCGEETCHCARRSIGAAICFSFELSRCSDSCGDCPEGTVCDAESACCGGGPVCFQPCPPFGGVTCFTGQTRIAMADGTSRPINEIAFGDTVVGADGQINRVEAIHTPRLGSKPLYALNDDRFFVTAEHPFMTEAGWKAIDPAATARTHPDLKLGRLMVGDRLQVLSGVLVAAGVGGVSLADEPVAVKVESVLLERIDQITADPATPLYNLRLDGNHTYFANDLLVHNK
jgi:Hint-domain